MAQITAPQASLSIWDIDETLFKTKAKIHVLKNGRRVRSLTNQQFNTYKLKDKEEFDFSEFRSADIFHNTSEPIKPAFAKAVGILKAYVNKPGSKMIVLTARADFDNKEKFLSTFEKHGLDMKHIYVERAGNLKTSAAEAKQIIVRKYLSTGKFGKVTLFDDDLRNLRLFLSLETEFPNIRFVAYWAQHGVMRRFR